MSMSHRPQVKRTRARSENPIFFRASRSPASADGLTEEEAARLMHRIAQL